MKYFVSIFIVLSLLAACTKSDTSSSDSAETATEDSSATQLTGDPATLMGKVTYTGKKKKRKPVKMTADAACVKQNAGKKVLSESLIVGAGGGLANAFVYVKGSFPNAPSGSSLPAKVLDQKGCMYTPHVWGVQTGQKISILNSDPTLHNVNALAKNNPKFNVGMATKGQKIDKVFKKPEQMVKIKCDVHGWMTTYVGVVDHPYFAVTDAQGNFTIKNLPPGTGYTLMAWHEKLGTQTIKVDAQPGASEKVSITYN